MPVSVSDFAVFASRDARRACCASKEKTGDAIVDCERTADCYNTSRLGNLFAPKEPGTERIALPELEPQT